MQLLLLNFCEFLLLWQCKKTWNVLWSVWVFFAFLKKRRPNKYCLWEVNLIKFNSYMQIFSLICQSVNLDRSYSSLKCWLYFRQFLSRTQNNFPPRSCSSFKFSDAVFVKFENLKLQSFRKCLAWYKCI